MRVAREILKRKKSIERKKRKRGREKRKETATDVIRRIQKFKFNVKIMK